MATKNSLQKDALEEACQELPQHFNSQSEQWINTATDSTAQAKNICKQHQEVTDGLLLFKIEKVHSPFKHAHLSRKLDCVARESQSLTTENKSSRTEELSFTSALNPWFFVIAFPLLTLEGVASSEKSLLSHMVQQEPHLENATASEGWLCRMLEKKNVRDDWFFLLNRKDGLVCNKGKKRTLHSTAEGKLLQHDLSVWSAAAKLLPAFSFDEMWILQWAVEILEIF